MFKIGDSVKIKDVTTSPELNGAKGVIVEMHSNAPLEECSRHGYTRIRLNEPVIMDIQNCPFSSDRVWLGRDFLEKI